MTLKRFRVVLVAKVTYTHNGELRGGSQLDSVAVQHKHVGGIALGEAVAVGKCG